MSDDEAAWEILSKSGIPCSIDPEGRIYVDPVTVNQVLEALDALEEEIDDDDDISAQMT